MKGSTNAHTMAVNVLSKNGYSANACTKTADMLSKVGERSMDARTETANMLSKVECSMHARTKTADMLSKVGERSMDARTETANMLSKVEYSMDARTKAADMLQQGLGDQIGDEHARAVFGLEANSDETECSAGIINT